MNHRDAARPANQAMLLLILFLDLLGFTIVFPIVPDLLSHYLTQAPGIPADTWLISARDSLNGVLPAERRTTANLILLMGGLLSALYAVLQFVAAPYWGRLSDRIGRRPVLLLTSTGLAVSYILWFFAQSFSLLVLSRVLGGLMAGNLGVASAAMADITPADKRTRAMGLVGAAFGMGFLVGPVVGGLTAGLNDLVASVAPGMIFQPFAATALLAFTLSLLSAVCNALFFHETFDIRAHGSTHNFIENPLRAILTNLRVPVFGPVLFINLLYIGVFAAFEFSFTFLYKLEFGLGPREIGLVFFYMGIVLVLGQGGLVRQLSKRWPPRRLLIVGLSLMPLPMALLALTPPSLTLSLVALFPVAVGSSLVQPAIAGLASLAAPPDRQGIALGLLRSAGALGRAAGPLIGAYAYWSFGAVPTYCGIGAALFLTLLFALRLPALAATPEN